MRLSAAQLNKIIEAESPKTIDLPNGNTLVREAEEQKADIIRSFTSFQSAAAGRTGEVLPPPPKSLVTLDSYHNVEGLGVDHESGLPTALLGINLDEIQTRAELIYALTQNLPLNEYQLPKIIFRTDLLDLNLFKGNSPEGSDTSGRYQEMQDALNAATIHLSYTEGFPALPNGNPLWAQFEWEAKDQFNVFLEYCTLPGVRLVSKIISHPQDVLLAWYHEGYWALRAKCYDMMHAIHHAKVKEQRILGCEDTHFKQAEALLQRVTALQNTVEWDLLKGDPKEYVNVLEKAIKLQRLALGLAAATNNKEQKEQKVETTEVVLRRMTKDDTPLKLRDDGIDVKKLLRNPEALGAAQELIVRMTKSTQTQTSTGDTSMADGGDEE